MKTAGTKKIITINLFRFWIQILIPERIRYGSALSGIRILSVSIRLVCGSKIPYLCKNTVIYTGYRCNLISMSRIYRLLFIVYLVWIVLGGSWRVGLWRVPLLLGIAREFVVGVVVGISWSTGWCRHLRLSRRGGAVHVGGANLPHFNNLSKHLKPELK